MPLPLSLWLIHPKLEMCEAFRARFKHLSAVRILQSRFEDLPPHDCFVTAGNAYGIMNAGIDAAVIHFHGPDLMRRVQARILNEYLGEQPVGTAFVEPTGTRDYPFLVHAPTMRTPSDISGTDRVYAATWAALLATYRYRALHGHDIIHSVAFPAMGAGFGGVPYPEVARQMAAAYEHYLSPPHVFSWNEVARRERAISYDGDKRVVR